MTDLTIANTILEQLGGRVFRAMTGAKEFVGGSDYLMFKIGRNRSGANKVKITLTGRDDYTVEFMRLRNYEITVLDTVEGVYADTLRDTFTSKTGLDTHL